MSEMHDRVDPAVVLIVANETLSGSDLVEAVRRRAAQGPIRAVVVAPVCEPRAGYVVYEDSRRAAAGRRLDRTVAALRAEGIPAHGGVFDSGPLDAVRDTLAQEDIDELIVSTHPEEKSGWLRRHLIDEVRRVAEHRRVEHVVADPASMEATSNVLVIANETVLDDLLLGRIRARAAEGSSTFLVVCPQSDPGESAHPEAERRLRKALSQLRADGIEAHGQISHPDPYTAAMTVIHDERVDELIVSTFGSERSGWLRRDLVGRLRTDAKVPVEHVVATAVPEGVAS